MALSVAFKANIVSSLPPAYRDMYDRGEITDEQLEAYAAKLGMVAPPDFSNVESSSRSTEENTQPEEADDGMTAGFRDQDLEDLETIGTAAKGGGQSTLSGLLRLSADPESAPGIVGRAVRALDPYVNEYLPSVAAKRDEARAAFMRGSDSFYEDAQANKEEVQRELDETSGFRRGFMETSTDVAGTPSSLVSVVGGPAAAIGATDVYVQEYNEGIRNGMTPEAARERAGMMAGVEGGISTIPAGRFGSAILRRLGLNRVGGEIVKSDARVLAERLGKTAFGEGTEEAVTEAVQVGIDAGLAATADSEEDRRFSEANLPEDGSEMVSRLWRTFRAGAAGGTALGGPLEGFNLTKEQGQRAAQLLREKAKAKNIEDQHVRRETEFDQRVTAELFYEEQRLAQEQAKRDAFEQRDRDLAREQALGAEQRSLEEEAGFRTLDLENQFRGQTRLERYGDVLERTQINPPAEVTPEQVKDERITAQRELQSLDERAEIITLQSQIAARKRAMAAAQTKSAKASEKAALTKEAKQRQEVLDNIIKNNSDLTPEQQALLAREELAKLRTAAPVVQTPAATTPQRTGNPIKQEELDAQRRAIKENFPDMSDEQIEARINSSNRNLSVLELQKKVGKGLAQKADDGKTDTTLDDVFDTMVAKLGNGDVKLLTKLMTDGNLRVVADDTRIPAAATNSNTQGAAGYFDGNTTYIVANRLNKKNIVGEMLHIAAHEVKHAADTGATPALKASLGEFIGTKANSGIIRKIETLAEAGDGRAKRAVETARKNSTPATYALELPAYYVQEARGAQNNTILAKRVLGDIVSAVRTKAKKFVGNADVNLKDVAYLSQKLLEDVAITGDRLRSKDNKGLPMILGSNARTAPLAKELGLVYTSRDGRSKFWMSDKNSKVVKPDLSKKKVYTLGEILQHDDLYAEYPELHDVAVQFVDELPHGAHGSFAPRENKIKLLSRFADDASYNSAMHKFLIHESQHAIQAIEGHDGGASAEMFLDKNYWKDQLKVDQLQSDLINVATAMASGKLKRFGIHGDHDFRTQFDLSQEPEMVAAQAIQALRELGSNASTNTHTVQSLRDNQVRAYLDLQAKQDAAYMKAYGEYRKNLGEQEAFFAENSIDLPEDEAPINPERTLFPDSTLAPETGETVISEANGLASVSLDSMRDALSGKQIAEGWGYKTLMQIFSSHGGLGKEIRNLREKARGLAAVFSHRAAADARRINSGYGKIAKRLGKTEEQVKAEIEKRLNSLVDLPDEQLRRTALIGIGRTYPEIRGPLLRSYATIKHLSSSIIRQMIEANPEPTEQELKLMNYIANNNYGYTTRMFAMFQGSEGRKLARAMQKDVKKAEKLMEQQKNVPADVKESFRIWNAARNYIAKNDVAIPDAQTLSKRKLEKVKTLYDLWFPQQADRAYTLAKEEAIRNGSTIAEGDAIARAYLEGELLALAPEVDQTDIIGKSDDIIAGMLEIGDTTNPIARYYRGFKEDRSILEHREKLPVEIRELFGEITDPATRLAITIAKQGELVARGRFFLDLRRVGKGQHVISKEKAGLKGNEKFSVELSGEAFGALDGWRTTPEIKAALADQLEIYTSIGDALRTSFWNPDTYNNAAARALMKGVFGIAKWNKLLTVVVDFWNGAQNAIGSPLMLIMNGVYNPKYWKDALKLGSLAVVDTIWETDGTMTKDFEDLVRYELLDSARAQEIRSTPYDQVRKLLDKEQHNSLWNLTKTGAKGTSRFGIEAYSMLDAWVKIAAFRHEVDYLTDFYQKAGEEVSRTQIKLEAADRVKDTNIGFSRTPGAVRALERVGAVTFLPYFVSVYRSIAMNGVVASRDFIRAADQNLPMEARMAAASHGSKRAMGSIMALGAITHGLQAVLAAAVGDEDEERLEKIKQLMYEDARYAASLPVGVDAEGNYLWWRASRVDPLGPATDVYRILLNDNLSPEEKAKGMKEMFVGLIFANRALINAGKLTADVALDLGKPKETKLERVSPFATRAFVAALDKVPGIDNSDANSVVEFINSFTPGMFDYLDPTVPEVAEELKSVRAPQKEISWIVNGLGGRLDKADPGLAAWEVTRNLSDFRKNDGRPAMNDAQLSLSDTASMNIFLDKAAEEYELMLRVAEVYEGMTEGMGMKSAEAIKVLKEANPGALTQKDLSMLARGDIPSSFEEYAQKYSRLLSEKSLEQRQRRYDKTATKEEQKAAERKRQAWLDAFEAAGYHVSEDKK